MIQSPTSTGPSWAALVFAWIYLAAMRQYRAAAGMVLLLGLVVVSVASPGVSRSLTFAAGLAYVGLWAYYTVWGRRLVWESGQWRDAGAFERRQQQWDRWALVVLSLVLPILAVGLGVIAFEGKRKSVIILVVFAGVAVIVARRVRTSGRAPRPATGVPQRANLRDARVEGFPRAQPEAAGGFPAATPVARPAAADPPLLLIRAAADALTMMIRRPALSLPFLLMVAPLVALFLLTGVASTDGAPLDDPESFERLLSRAPVAFLVAVLATGFLYILAGETTSHLAAQVELGAVPALRTALSTALRRLPAYFVASILLGLGVLFGFVFFILPGIMLVVRWMLVPPAIIIGGARPLSAFRISRSLTIGRWWRFLGFGLLIMLGGLAINGALDTIPYVGSFLSAWLAFCWFTIALTLAYLRVGGPVK